MGIAIAIVASMDREVSALKRLSKDGRVLMHVTGVGKERALAGMVALLEGRNTRPDCILSLGFAGALRDGLETGDLVLSQQLYTIGEDTVLESDAALLSLSQDILDNSDSQRYSIANSLTVPQIVFGAVGKSRLAISSTSSIVNMEDYWVGQAAIQHGIPFLSVRAVLDTAKQELPPFVGGLGDKGTLTQVLQVGANVVARPENLPRLVKLVKQVKVAQESLASFAISFISRVTTAGSYAIYG